MKSRITTTTIVLFLIFSICIKGHCQDNNYNYLNPFSLRNTTPPSANAASLGVFGDVSTNLYAGQVDINIPIWTVKSREISFPISLSYNASGLKVNDFAGWVGLGWSLQGVGAITRTLRGLQDEISDLGYLSEGKYIPDNPSNTSELYNLPFDLFLKAAEGEIDLEPDIFSYNFCGHSGDFSFHIDSSGNRKIYFSPWQNYKISYGHDAYSIYYWNITTDDGYNYTFGNTSMDNSYNGVEMTDMDQCADNVPDPDYYSTWYMKQIISPSKGDTVTFEYDPDSLETVAYPLGESETSSHLLSLTVNQYIPPCPSDDFKTCQIQRNVYTRKLKKITTAISEIIFHNYTPGEVAGEKCLSKISIVDRFTLDTIRRFHFYYSTVNQRLWLDSVQEENQGLKKTYSLAYYNRNNVPSRANKGQDHWGYYNGKNNSSLIPQMIYGGQLLSGGNREVDTSKVTFGTLQKITYPTKGYTNFDFESKDFGLVEDSAVSTIFYIDEFTDATHKCLDAQNDTAVSDLYVDHGQYILFSMDASKCAGRGDDALAAYVGVRKTNYQIVYQWVAGTNGFTSSTQNVWVPLGHYQLYAYVDDTNQTAQLVASWQNCDTAIIHDTLHYQFGGGIRIKRISSFDGTNTIIHRFVYRWDTAMNISTGVLLGQLPAYNYVTTNLTDQVWGGGAHSVEPCTYLMRFSTPVFLQGMTKGSYVGYPQVTELLGENGENGKIIHSYSFANDIGSDKFPFAPKTSLEYIRGFETNKETFDNQNHLREIKTNLYQYTYRWSNNNFASIGGVKVGILQKAVGMDDEYFTQLSIKPYFIYSGWNYPYSETTTTLDNNGLNPVKDSVAYYYDQNNLQTNRIDHINSDGVVKIKRFRYPVDYAGIGSDTYGFALTMMRDSLHMIKSVVEYLELERKTTDTNELIIGGNVNLYSRYSTNDFLAINPYKSLGFETMTLISLSSFTKSAINKRV
ncbi:MAG: hypothetical protein ABSD71_12255 [Bacteroidales bacterium]|jgi:hypothetical protein